MVWRKALRPIVLFRQEPHLRAKLKLEQETHKILMAAQKGAADAHAGAKARMHGRSHAHAHIHAHARMCTQHACAHTHVRSVH